MTGREPDAGLSIPDLLSTATSLLERVDGPLLPGSQGPLGPALESAARMQLGDTRRIHHLNSPRPQELSAMLGEIAACLAGEARRR